MKNRKHIFKSAVALILVAVFLSTIPISALAETISVTLKPCVATDNSSIVYVDNAQNKDGKEVCTIGHTFFKIYTGVQTDDNLAYCIQKGYPLNDNNVLDSEVTSAWDSFSKELKKSINLTLAYGLSGNSNSLIGNTDEKYVATQIIIWELIDGYRNLYNKNFKCTNNEYYNAVCANGANANVAKNYEIISKTVEEYSIIPSFTSETRLSSPVLTLHWDGEKYSTTVTDTNGVLDSFVFSSNDVELTQEGNKLTISCDEAISDQFLVSAEKIIPTAITGNNLVAYSSANGSIQDVVKGNVKPDPYNVYFKLETTESKLKIVKRDIDSGEIISLEGFGFKIQDTKGNYIKDSDGDEVFYTDVTGTVSIPVPLDMGTYYIEEVEAVGGYSINNEKLEFEIDGSETVIIIDFYDKVEKGSITLYKTGSSIVSINEETENGYTVKRPVWSDGGEKIKGANFSLFAYKDIVTPDGVTHHKAGDLIVGDVEVNNLGELTFDDLYFGEYKIIETEAPYGYTKGGSKIVTISPDSEETKNVTTTIVNYPKRLIVNLQKTLKNDSFGLINPEEEITKVCFGLYAGRSIYSNDLLQSIKPGELIDIAFADKDGNIYFNDTYVGIGNYFVKELETSPYYALDEKEYEVIITDESDPVTETALFKKVQNDNGEFTFKNNLITSPMSIRKVSEENAPLGGAEIEIYTESGKYVGTYTSNADGWFIQDIELPIGTYLYKETKAPEGYLLDENEYTFEVTGAEDEVIDLTLKNEPIMGNIKVLKTGEIFSSVTTNTNENGIRTYIPNFEEGSLNGAEFEIIADGDIITPDGTLRYKDGDVVETLVTTNDGTATSSDLYLGNYIIREKKAPDGYKISFDEIKLTLSADYTFVTTDEIKNNRNRVYITLRKELEKDETSLISEESEIKYVAYGLFADEKIVGADGSYIPEGGLIEKQYCDHNGMIFFNADLPNGNYYVQEMETSPYYILDDTKHVFRVDNTNGEEVIDITKGGSFINELITKEISLKKVAKDTGKPLGGAEIEIATAEGTVFYIGITEQDGTLPDVPKLPIGKYTYRERKAPEGYLLDENEYTFEVTGKEADGDVIELTLENDIILGKITVLKVGERFTEVKTDTDENGTTTYQPLFNNGNLQGAEFNIIAKEDIITPDGTLRYNKGDVVDTIVTGEDGTATSSDLYLGTYIVKETKAPNEYDINEQEIDVTLTPANSIITTQPVSNSRHKVNISLTKTMETDKWNLIDVEKEITKVSFGVFANEDITADNGSYIPKDGLIQKLNCDVSGNIKFTVALPFGSYYVQEIETSEFYVLDDTKHFFNIDYSVDTSSVININLNEDGEFYNRTKTTQIDFKKVAKNTNSPLEGCEIVIKNGDTIVYQGTTGVNGKLVGVPYLPVGTYTYQELKAPEGYLLDSNVYTFKVTGKEKVIELVMENVPITGGIEITKTDIATDKALPNCGIRLLDEKGNVIVEKRTDSKGKVLFDNLTVGKYYYQEFDAPDGYIIDTNKYPFEIKENGVIIKAVLENKKEETPKTPSTPNTPTTPTTPNTPTPEQPKVPTGQSVHTSTFIVILILSAGVIFMTKSKVKKFNAICETEGKED